MKLTRVLLYSAVLCLALLGGCVSTPNLTPVNDTSPTGVDDKGDAAAPDEAAADAAAPAPPPLPPASNCAMAASCHVSCTGDQACGPVRSAAAQTDIVCSGKDACNDTSCSGGACTVQCSMSACVAKDVKCCATTCTVNGAPGQCM